MRAKKGAISALSIMMLKTLGALIFTAAAVTMYVRGPQPLSKPPVYRPDPPALTSPAPSEIVVAPFQGGRVGERLQR